MDEFFGKRRSPAKKAGRKMSKDMCEKSKNKMWIKKSKTAKGHCRKMKSRSRK
jgi:hypothetical protein